MVVTALGSPSASWLHARNSGFVNRHSAPLGRSVLAVKPTARRQPNRSAPLPSLCWCYSQMPQDNHTSRTGCMLMFNFRRVPLSEAKSSAAAGGPPGPTDGGAGNFGGGDDSNGDGHQSPPKNSLLKGWEERIAADPQFTYKVFVEQVCRWSLLSTHLATYCKQAAEWGSALAGHWGWSCCARGHVIQTLLGPVRAGLCLLYNHCEPGSGHLICCIAMISMLNAKSQLSW